MCPPWGVLPQVYLETFHGLLCETFSILECQFSGGKGRTCPVNPTVSREGVRSVTIRGHRRRVCGVGVLIVCVYSKGSCVVITLHHPPACSTSTAFPHEYSCPILTVKKRNKLTLRFHGGRWNGLDLAIYCFNFRHHLVKRQDGVDYISKNLGHTLAQYTSETSLSNVDS